MSKQMVAFFSGQVQGVGFRFTVDRIAHHFEVTGYVRNLSDGRVEVKAEGDESILKDFLAAIRESAMQPYIRDLEVLWTESDGRYKAFGIALS